MPLFGPGSAGQPIPHPEGDVYDPQQWGGVMGHTTDGVYDAKANSFRQDVDRYQAMGRAGNLSTQIDQTAGNQSRGAQTDAMGLARDAAYGKAPSAAEIYGGRMIDDSVNSQMAMAASARGGPSAIAGAQRQAAFQGAQTQQTGARDLAAMRAQEMAQARDSYAGQAGQMRGQDLSVATAQAGLDDANAGRQQQNQQYYEGLGWNTKKQQQDAAMQQEHERNQFWLGRRGLKQQENRDDWDKIKSGMAMGGSLIGSAFSDIRTKEDVVPLGGGGLIRENPYGGGAPANDPTAQWERSFGPKENAIADVRKHDNQVEGQIIRSHFAEPEQQGGGGFGGFMGRFGQGMAGMNSGARPAYMPMMSDERSKDVYVGARANGGPVQGGEPYLVGERGPELVVPNQSGYVVPNEVVSLGDTEEGQLRATPEGRAYYQKPLEAPEPHPAFSGSSSASSHGESKAKASRPHEQTHKMTDDEMMREADRMMGSMKSDHERYMARGPAVDPVADANRAQAGSIYSYKPEFASASGQAPGERNVGPMAQTMASDPLASTAVKSDPATGMLTLDRDKLLKLQSAGIASLQQQLDSLYARGGR